MFTRVEFSQPKGASTEALSYSFGMRLAIGAGEGVSRNAQPHDMQFSKVYDRLSPMLMRYFQDASRLENVWVRLYRAAKSPAYATYTMGDVIVTLFQVSSEVELVGLNFTKFRFEYAGS